MKEKLAKAIKDHGESLGIEVSIFKDSSFGRPEGFDSCIEVPSFIDLVDIMSSMRDVPEYSEFDLILELESFMSKQLEDSKYVTLYC